MQRYSIGPLTGPLKPKYRVISQILGESFNPQHGLDIFIDLNSLVTSMGMSQKFLSSLPFAENVEQDIIANLLFTFKHWKDFSRKWEDVRIIMMVNDFECELLAESDILTSYLVPYKNKYSSDKYNQMVYYWNEAVKRVQVILKYIPNAYFIKCDRFDSFVLPEIISNSEERFKIIISSSSLMTNYTYMPNTHVIYSRWRGGNGTSQLSDPLMIVQSISKIDDEIMGTFIRNRVFYNLLNAIIGDFDRGLIGLSQMGISAFAADLLRAVERKEIPENPQNLDSVLSIIDSSFHDYLSHSYPLVDIPTHVKMVKPSMIEKVKSEMVDLIDIDGLYKFTIEGLNLLELL